MLFCVSGVFELEVGVFVVLVIIFVIVIIGVLCIGFLRCILVFVSFLIVV